MICVRGDLRVWWQENALLDLADMAVDFQLQMLPVRAGAFDFGSALSVNNAADLESNRIIWKRSYYPADQVVLTLAAEDLHPGAVSIDTNVDIKSQRRFDRATWGIALLAEAVNMDEKFFAGNLRALFATSDGI